MTSKFLICGSPRARTAWLAALCNTIPGCVCYHEPIVYRPTWRYAAALWRVDGYEAVGIADSGFSFHLGPLMAMYRPRVLIVDRPADEIEKSIQQIGLPLNNYTELLAEALEPWRAHPSVLSVPFSDLEHPAALRAALGHILPGHRVDPVKVEIFQRMNIQTDMQKMAAGMAGRDPAEVLGGGVVERLVPR